MAKMDKALWPQAARYVIVVEAISERYEERRRSSLGTRRKPLVLMRQMTRTLQKTFQVKDGDLLRLYR